MRSHRVKRTCLSLVSIALLWAFSLTGPAEAENQQEVRYRYADSSDAQRDDSASASTAASELGHRVEDTSKRTEWERVFANPDGSWTSEIASEPERVRDEVGWHSVDTTLMRDGEIVRPRYAVGDLQLSAGGSNRTFARMTRAGHPIEWQWPSDLPAPRLVGSTATYPEVVPGGDLVVEATVGGFRHSIVLRQRPSDEVSQLLVDVNVKSELDLVENEMGGLELENAGRVFVRSPRPMMWDATTEPDGQHLRTSSVGANVTRAGGRTPSGKVAKEQTITLAPQMAFLRDPATEYPVTIDPEFTVYLYTDTWLYNRDYTSGQTASEDLRVGTWDAGEHMARTFILFGQSSFAGKQVTEATLRLNNYASHVCGIDSIIQAARITSPWSSSTITWSNQPSTSGDDVAVYATPHGNGAACPSGNADFDVTAMAKGWASGVYPNHGVRLRARDEAFSNASWRKYRSGNYVTLDSHPKMIVTYNEPPGVPETTLPFPSNAWKPPWLTSQVLYVADPKPEFINRVGDADGSASIRFEVYAGSSSGPLVGSCTTPMGEASVEQSCSLAVDLADGQAYRVRAKGYDGLAWSSGTSMAEAAGWSPWVHFRTQFADSQAPTLNCGALADGEIEQSLSDVTCSIQVQGGPLPAARLVYQADGTVPNVVYPDAATPGVIAKQLVFGAGEHHVRAWVTTAAGEISDVVEFRLAVGSPNILAPSRFDRVGGVSVLVEGAEPTSPEGAPVVLQWRQNGGAWNELGSVAFGPEYPAGRGRPWSYLWNTRGLDTDPSTGIELDRSQEVAVEVRSCGAPQPNGVCQTTSVPRQVFLAPLTPANDSPVSETEVAEDGAPPPLFAEAQDVRPTDSGVAGNTSRIVFAFADGEQLPTEEPEPSFASRALRTNVPTAPPWGACGWTDSQDKEVRRFWRNVPPGRFGIIGDYATLRCGRHDEQYSNGYGLRHIQDRGHDDEFQGYAWVINRQWRTLADFAIKGALSKPSDIKFRYDKNTFCYARKIYVIRDGETVAEFVAQVIMGRTGRRIISAYPSEGKCRKFATSVDLL